MFSADKFAVWTLRLRRSSSLRLTLVLSFIFSIGMVVTIFVALSLGHDRMLSRADAALSETAAAIASGTIPDETRTLIVRRNDRLDDLPAEFARIAATGGGTLNLDDDFRESEDWRVLIADANPTPILIAVSLDDGDDALELIEGVLWSTAAIVLFAALSVGIGAGLLVEQRLSRITYALGRLADGDLEARTGIARNSDDLDALASHVDAAASDLERLVLQTRHLSASLAHDLRTPLARLRVRLEALPEGDERSAALDEAARLSEIFDAIMRIARIEATQGVDGLEAVDLTELGEDVAETFGPVVEDAGKSLSISTDNAGVVSADRQMLIQALANMIQNALVHGGAEITLFVRGPEIGVTDTGRGVDRSQLDEITKPMVRLETARQTDGSGLGLALVRAVADRHGANLILTELHPQGLSVSLRF